MKRTRPYRSGMLIIHRFRAESTRGALSKAYCQAGAVSVLESGAAGRPFPERRSAFMNLTPEQRAEVIEIQRQFEASKTPNVRLEQLPPEVALRWRELLQKLAAVCGKPDV